MLLCWDVLGHLPAPPDAAGPQGFALVGPPVLSPAERPVAEPAW